MGCYGHDSEPCKASSDEYVYSGDLLGRTVCHVSEWAKFFVTISCSLRLAGSEVRGRIEDWLPMLERPAVRNSGTDYCWKEA